MCIIVSDFGEFVALGVRKVASSQRREPSKVFLQGRQFLFDLSRCGMTTVGKLWCDVTFLDAKKYRGNGIGTVPHFRTFLYK